METKQDTPSTERARLERIASALGCFDEAKQPQTDDELEADIIKSIQADARDYRIACSYLSPTQRSLIEAGRLAERTPENTTFHMHAEKGWVMRQIERWGASVIGIDVSKEEAIKLVEACPTRFIPMESGNERCDRRDEDGRCMGHRKPVQWVDHAYAPDPKDDPAEPLRPLSGKV